MTDLDPQRSPTLTNIPEPTELLQPLPTTPTKPANKIMPWVLTLFLHGLIFSGAYVLYQRAVQSNQTLTTATAPTSATAITVQKEVLKTLRDSSTPIAIDQEAYAPAPKVRSDLPVLTTADIIAQGNAIRAALNGDTADSTVSATALTVTSSTAKTGKLTSQSSEKTTAMMMDASDETLTDRDIPAKDRKTTDNKNAAKVTAPEALADTAEQNTTKTDKKGNPITKTGKIQKTTQAHHNSSEADKLSKELEATTADLSRNIDIVKNKNRQKIAKEFNIPKTVPSADKADDSLHSEDVPSKK